MIRRLLCALLLLLPAGAALSQESGFKIETITIEGGRRPATEEIVIEESRREL